MDSHWILMIALGWIVGGESARNRQSSNSFLLMCLGYGGGLLLVCCALAIEIAKMTHIIFAIGIPLMIILLLSCHIYKGLK